MDPLSVTANVIAVLSTLKAAIQVLERLRDLLKAPEQLLQTLNEVRELNISWSSRNLTLYKSYQGRWRDIQAVGSDFLFRSLTSKQFLYPFKKQQVDFMNSMSIRILCFVSKG